MVSKRDFRGDLKGRDDGVGEYRGEREIEIDILVVGFEFYMDSRGLAAIIIVAHKTPVV